MKKLIATVLITSLAACASNDPARYLQAEDSDHYGYYESKLSDNRYRVSFNGNTRTNSDEVRDMALLRAAELTLLNNHDWFRISNQQTEHETTSSPRTSTAISNNRQVYRNCGLLGCTTTVSPSYSSIEVVSGLEKSVYSTSIEIVMGDGEVEDSTTVYDASMLHSFLDEKY